MKRILTIFGLMATLMMFVVACGNKPAEGEQVKEGKTASETKNVKKNIAIVYSTGGKGDKSFNDSAFRGLQKAQKELGITFKEYEPKDASSEAKDIAIIDDEIKLPNVVSLKYKEEEGSFLVGAVAAMMTKTGTIGFVGANESDLIKKFYDGYEQGAKYVKPDIKVLKVYIGGSNAFNDPASAKAKTETLIQQKADVIYHASGASGAGVFQAVKEKNVYGIGVDSNQDGLYPGTILTSMMKYVDNTVFDTIKSVVDGNFKAETKIFGIKENGVGTTNFEFTKDKIGEENIKKLEQIKQDIRDGKIVVKP